MERPNNGHIGNSHFVIPSFRGRLVVMLHTHQLVYWMASICCIYIPHRPILWNANVYWYPWQHTTNFVVQQSHEHGIIKTSLVVLPQGTINTATIFDLQSYCTQSRELVRVKERELYLNAWTHQNAGSPYNSSN